MSSERASEQLRELVDSHGWPPVGLKEAMPELLAVVEAAENPNALRGDLDRVLSVLASKLSGKGQG